MSEKTERAAAYREQDYNCAQAVLGAFCTDLDLDEDTALRIAAGFGGGMGRQGEVCGALTGGFMAIGLKYGSDNETAYELVGDLSDRFHAQNGAIRCRELIGLDLRDPQERQRGRDEGIFKARCSGCVQQAVEILEEIL